MVHGRLSLDEDMEVHYFKVTPMKVSGSNSES